MYVETRLNDDVLLDNHASNASPPAESRRNTGLTEDQKNKEKFKKKRHFLRKTAGTIMKKERVAICGQKTIGSFVTLHCQNNQATYGGVETCSSVWMCPVCAAKITEGRREELEQITKKHREAGGKLAMITLTLPHHQFQTCRALRAAVSHAWRKVKVGKGWQKTRDRAGWIGDVRAMEVTYGASGWHPHLHVLAFFEADTDDALLYDFGDMIYQKWQKAIAKQGFGECNKDAFKFDIITDDQGVGEYVSKWGVACELTKGHIKQSNGGRTPWQILADYHAHGDRKDKRLFFEYALTFKGTKQLTWSRAFKRMNGAEIEGIRGRYDLADTSDEEICVIEEIAASHGATLDKNLFKQIVANELTASVLSAYENGGVRQIQAVLTHHKIPFHYTKRPSLEQGRDVPLLIHNEQGRA